MEAAKAFLDKEIGDLSTLTRAEQEAEMQWFIDAAKPFAGMDIKVVSETDHHARVRVEGAGPGLHRHHRHQDHPRPDQ